MNQFNWREHAECLGNPAPFFPPPAERPQAKVIREAVAKAICDNCLVVESCLDNAVDRGEYGFWGGETEGERHMRKPNLTYINPSEIKRGLKKYNEEKSA